MLSILKCLYLSWLLCVRSILVAIGVSFDDMPDFMIRRDNNDTYDLEAPANDNEEAEEEEAPAEDNEEAKEEEVPAEDNDEANKEEEAPAEDNEEAKDDEAPAGGNEEAQQDEVPTGDIEETAENDAPAGHNDEEEEGEEDPAVQLDAAALHALRNVRVVDDCNINKWMLTYISSMSCCYFVEPCELICGEVRYPVRGGSWIPMWLDGQLHHQHHQEEQGNYRKEQGH